MDAIRYATPEEIEAISANSDLTSLSQVLSFGGKDSAVVRQCTEVDPVYFHGESNTLRRRMFIFGIETALRLQGVKEIYYNVPVKDEAYIKVMETFGATPTSKEPELRFKKVL